MKAVTLEQFYREQLPKDLSDTLLHEMQTQKTTGNFNVYHRDSVACGATAVYSRRDFYKISLSIGQGALHYASKSIQLDKPALIFSNPNVPYAWEATSGEQSGYFCLFTEDFLYNKAESIMHSPLFAIGGNPVFFVDEIQQAFIASLFRKMEDEMKTDYVHKYDLVRNYVQLIIHEAMKMQPAENYVQHTNASSRIASLFIELLERQFPIDSPTHIFSLKSANDYATRLSVHVNHLNRAIKETTGKTTTEHIAERIVKEAKALLRHTDWSIAQVAYSLGFEYPAYFNNFFKKQTHTTPLAYKTAAV
ncbi:helix-turn-helix domain-containing protein [Deminuibacter soli]|uniref:Helix-turn-helix domain-containing protein n=1 Tax=Deminuibacter soli TaxID=2291815 RepID=A0A3E1NPN4_9BACT|nr:helix-turn-helix domain-containing protein [Deminuibacter soli]RFM29870.1 helix-turn-helix domain-containing protein [Deminuibacter soli]